MIRCIVIDTATGEPIELTEERETGIGAFMGCIPPKPQHVTVPWVSRERAEKIVRRAKSRLGKRYEIRELTNPEPRICSAALPCVMNSPDDWIHPDVRHVRYEQRAGKMIDIMGCPHCKMGYEMDVTEIFGGEVP